MHRTLIGTWVLALLLTSSIWAEDEKKKEDKPAKPAAMFQELLGKYNTTADVTARRELAVCLIQLHAEQVPVIPLWFSGNPAVVKAGVSGPGEVAPEVPATMWNINTWEIK